MCDRGRVYRDISARIVTVECSVVIEKLRAGAIGTRYVSGISVGALLKDRR